MKAAMSIVAVPLSLLSVDSRIMKELYKIKMWVYQGSFNGSVGENLDRA